MCCLCLFGLLPLSSPSAVSAPRPRCPFCSHSSPTGLSALLCLWLSSWLPLRLKEAVSDRDRDRPRGTDRGRDGVIAKQTKTKFETDRIADTESEAVSAVFACVALSLRLYSSLSVSFRLSLCVCPLPPLVFVSAVASLFPSVSAYCVLLISVCVRLSLPQVVDLCFPLPVSVSVMSLAPSAFLCLSVSLCACGCLSAAVFSRCLPHSLYFLCAHVSVCVVCPIQSVFVCLSAWVCLLLLLLTPA